MNLRTTVTGKLGHCFVIPMPTVGSVFKTVDGNTREVKWTKLNSIPSSSVLNLCCKICRDVAEKIGSGARHHQGHELCAITRDKCCVPSPGTSVVCHHQGQVLCVITRDKCCVSSPGTSVVCHHQGQVLCAIIIDKCCVPSSLTSVCVPSPGTSVVCHHQGQVLCAIIIDKCCVPSSLTSLCAIHFCYG